MLGFLLFHLKSNGQSQQVSRRVLPSASFWCTALLVHSRLSPALPESLRPNPNLMYTGIDNKSGNFCYHLVPYYNSMPLHHCSHNACSLTDPLPELGLHIFIKTQATTCLTAAISSNPRRRHLEEAAYFRRMIYILHSKRYTYKNNFKLLFYMILIVQLFTRLIDSNILKIVSFF